MNHQSEYLKNLEEIRRIMERSSRFLSLSGLTGVFAGTVALLGALAVYIYKFDFFTARYSNGGVFIREDLLSGSELTNLITFLIVVGSIVLMLALSFGVYFTTRNARRKGLPVFDVIAKRMLVNLFIPLVTGGLFCLVLLYHNLLYLVAPSTLVFYGLALINASKYTHNDIRYLGICEIILGLIGLFFAGYGLLIWAFGFGVLHIVYGIVMYNKYERTNT